MNGKGSLAELEKLKKEWAPKFRAAAPPRRRITKRCLEARCDLALSRLKFAAGELRIVKTTCYRKGKCPREK